ncbi:hypothetical protein BDN70DRAFT_832251 [Pholiota conissans]|uniref:Uncharacterized protein n=1 Tax=Pholiota conissans TaxID=109636 RepID=A0A9P5Z3D6_9AGAR|nr:hypothetical protein BDN70DRAFT_832251 [Pholiota conissans]
MESRSAYNGPRRKLVLAFDVGTTFSSISYSILDPGQVPELKGVTRFPAHDQLHISGAPKIPSIIYYDSNGKVKAVGAEAMVEGIYEQAEDEQWVKAEWFKLHLRSRVNSETEVSLIEKIPPLPPNKTAVEVFADFLTYLHECAGSYIQDAYPNGVALWASVKDEIDFVLSHPNGWEGKQQAEMRKAAIHAGLIPNTAAGHSRLSFVTEGEASLHFAIQNGLPSEAIKSGDGIVVVDAGGGTIDISSYKKRMSVSSQTFEEVAIPQCHFHGSVFVSVYAQRFLESYLADSPFADDVKHIVQCFDKTTKLRFRSTEVPQYIKFGSTRDNDADHNIRFGQLKIPGTDIAEFFQPSIDCIVKAVLEQKDAAHAPISHVVLVGGFSASDYMLTKIHAALNSCGLSIHRPENNLNKAVSEGAISFYLDRFVGVRISKMTYGVECHTLYNPNDPEHRNRIADTFVGVSGEMHVGGKFSVILPKNTQISETKEFRRHYSRTYESDFDHRKVLRINEDISCYRGSLEEPKWKDVDTENYGKLCSVEAEFSKLPRRLLQKITGLGTYYRVDFDIVLIFGLTELKAQIAWKEGGIKKRSEAKIVYDDDSDED